MFVRLRKQTLASLAVFFSRLSIVSTKRISTNGNVWFTELLRAPISLDTRKSACKLVPKWPIDWSSIPATSDIFEFVGAIVSVSESSDPGPCSALGFLSLTSTVIS
jgi:hypothetical protein